MPFAASDLLFALAPLAVLIYWMTKRASMPARRALPLAALLLYLVQLAWFGAPPDLVHAAVIDGLLTAITPILIVAGAILLFQTMELSGAMDTLRAWLNAISADRVAQVMIVGWAFSFLVEGASGFGTPAALAAPILVGLGFPPVGAAIVCLMMNTVPVSFGAVGTPIWFGFSQLDLSQAELRQIGIKTALMNAAGAMFIPVMALSLLVGWRAVRERLRFVYLSILCCVAPYVLLAMVDDEFPAVGGGLIGLLLTVVLARYRVGLGRADADTVEHRQSVPPGRLIKALFPLWGTVLVLLVTRVEQLGIKALLNATDPQWQVSMGSLGTFGISPSLVVQLRGILLTDVNWSHSVLYVPSLLPFGLVVLITLAMFRVGAPVARQIVAGTSDRICAPVVALLGALVFVKLFMMGGDKSAAAILGASLAAAAGGAYPYVATFLGALGSFFTGSNTVSNLTFAPIQDMIAARLDLNRTTLLALQSAGGAMGNMICIHNIVAVCSVLGLRQQEGTILRQTAVAVLVYGTVVSIVGAFLL